jgi:ADP-ribose pyrophosphatase YjhB (NUDIX family)
MQCSGKSVDEADDAFDASYGNQGASVILLARDAVLMVRRSRPPFQDVWSFPGGRLEAGETAEAAARREVFEETGVTAGELQLLGTFDPKGRDTPFHLSVFAGLSETCDVTAGSDAAEAAFVPIGAVAGLPHTKGAVGWVARAVMALRAPALK